MSQLTDTDIPPTQKSNELAISTASADPPVTEPKRELLNWDDQLPPIELKLSSTNYDCEGNPEPFFDFENSDRSDSFYQCRRLAKDSSADPQQHYRSHKDPHLSTLSEKNRSRSASEDETVQKYAPNILENDEDTKAAEEIVTDMQIPADKIGLVIGKGGKSIKYLQEKSGAKMNVIQYRNQNQNTFDESDKTLRIIGSPDLVEHACQLVSDIISKASYRQQSQNCTHNHQNNRDHADDHDSNSNYSKGGRNQCPNNNHCNYQQNQQQTSNNKDQTHRHDRHDDSYTVDDDPNQRFETLRYSVPKKFVGLIIGKGGESIKRIRAETGAKVQFDFIDKSSNNSSSRSPNPNDMDQLTEQLANVTGKPDQIRRACDMIDDLISLGRKGQQQQREGQGYSQSKGENVNNSNNYFNCDSHRDGQRNNNSRTTRKRDNFPGPGDLRPASSEDTNRNPQRSNQYKYNNREDRDRDRQCSSNNYNNDKLKTDYDHNNNKNVYSNDSSRHNRHKKNDNDWKGQGSNSMTHSTNHRNYNTSENSYDPGSETQCRHCQDCQNSRNRNNHNNDYKEKRITVPAAKVKLILGKGKETLRLISSKSGASCEMERNGSGPGYYDGPGQDRVFVLRGNRKEIEMATELIKECINATSYKRNTDVREQAEFNPHRTSVSRGIKDEHNVDRHGSFSTESGSGFELEYSSDRGPYARDSKDSIVRTNRNEIETSILRPAPSSYSHSHSDGTRNRNHSCNCCVNNEWGQGDPSISWSSVDLRANTNGNGNNDERSPSFPRNQNSNHQSYNQDFQDQEDQQGCSKTKTNTRGTSSRSSSNFHYDNNDDDHKGHGSENGSGSSNSQWLEYFHPERQQAQADAWEQQVKAEQDWSSNNAPINSPKQNQESSLSDYTLPFLDSSSFRKESPFNTDENPPESMTRKIMNLDPASRDSGSNGSSYHSGLDSLKSSKSQNALHELQGLIPLENSIEDPSSPDETIFEPKIGETEKNIITDAILPNETELERSISNANLSPNYNYGNTYNTNTGTVTGFTEILQTDTETETEVIVSEPGQKEPPNLDESSTPPFLNQAQPEATNVHFSQQYPQQQRILGGYLNNIVGSGPSSTVVSFYYDLNCNSIVVINQCHYTY